MSATCGHFFILYFIVQISTQEANMICKKCGREYEDDMPKCLWCDTPNDSLTQQEEGNTSMPQSKFYCDIYKESPEKFVDSELEQSFADNVYRGKSAVSWTKFMIVINVILFIIEMRTINDIYAGLEGAKQSIPLSTEFYIALFTLIAFFIFAAIPLCVFLYKNWLWIYHAQKEQCKFTESFFSPWGAVFCYYLPLLNYFVFKDLFKGQKETLTIFRAPSASVPNKTLTCFFIINILMPISNILSYTNGQNILFSFLSTVTWIIFIVCNIKLIRAATANEQAMHDLLYNNMINRKADEIVAQRDSV
jgi:hypothetical protein